jgi:hypothetical protein
MTTPTEPPRKATARDLFFFAHPEHWPTWPFLPVVRRHAESSMDFGVLYDALHATGRTGYSSTVLLALCGTPHKASKASGALARLLPTFAFGGS